MSNHTHEFTTLARQRALKGRYRCHCQRLGKWEPLHADDLARAKEARVQREAAQVTQKLDELQQTVNAQRATYTEMTVKDLCAEAKRKGLKGYSKLTKDDLVDLLVWGPGGQLEMAHP